MLAHRFQDYLEDVTAIVVPRELEYPSTFLRHNLVILSYQVLVLRRYLDVTEIRDPLNPYSLASFLWDIGKQWRPRSDAAGCRVSTSYLQNVPFQLK